MLREVIGRRALSDLSYKMTSSQDNVDEVIEVATFKLAKKLEKAHTKHKAIANKSQNTSDVLQLEMKKCPLCQRTKEELESELESGRRSPIFNSPTTSAKFQRRRGVSERNSTEGRLVREAIKVSIVNETFQE